MYKPGDADQHCMMIAGKKTASPGPYYVQFTFTSDEGATGPDYHPFGFTKLFISEKQTEIDSPSSAICSTTGGSGLPIFIDAFGGMPITGVTVTATLHEDAKLMELVVDSVNVGGDDAPNGYITWSCLADASGKILLALSGTDAAYFKLKSDTVTAKFEEITEVEGTDAAPIN